MPFDVGAVRPDFVVTVGYKWLLGPLGVSYLYVAEEHRTGEPIEQNWIAREGSEDFARLVDYRDEYQPGARRFDVGQRTNFELVPMAIAALEQLGSWQVSRIAAMLSDVTGTIAAQATTLGLQLAPGRATRSAPARRAAVRRDARRGAADLAAAGCFAAVRGDVLRLAPHVHVTDADVDRLMEALRRIVAPRR